MESSDRYSIIKQTAILLSAIIVFALVFSSVAYGWGVKEVSRKQPASIGKGDSKNFSGKYEYDSKVAAGFPLPMEAQISIEVPVLCSAKKTSSSNFESYWSGKGTGGVSGKKVNYRTGRIHMLDYAELNMTVKATAKKKGSSKSYVGVGPDTVFSNTGTIKNFKVTVK